MGKTDKEKSKCHNNNKLGRSHDPRHQHSCCPKEDEMEHVMVIFLYLVVLLSKNRTTFAAEEMHDAMKIIHDVVARVKPRTLKGRTLVHLAVDSETPVDDFHINDVCNSLARIQQRFCLMEVQMQPPWTTKGTL